MHRSRKYFDRARTVLTFGVAFACVAAEPVLHFRTGSGIDPRSAKSKCKRCPLDQTRRAAATQSKSCTAAFFAAHVPYTPLTL
jgi:hypothetical protein